jgi:hypothetical protein
VPALPRASPAATHSFSTGNGSYLDLPTTGPSHPVVEVLFDARQSNAFRRDLLG